MLTQVYLWKQMTTLASVFTTTTPTRILQAFLHHLPFLPANTSSIFQYETPGKRCSMCEAVQLTLQSDYQQTMTSVFLILCAKGQQIDESLLQTVYNNNNNNNSSVIIHSTHSTHSTHSFNSCLFMSSL